jgi:TPR repeat protein
MYDEGDGVPQDKSEAAKGYRLAAAQGYPQAQVNMGAMYYQGQGVSTDYTQAYMWMKVAADGGDNFARQNVERIALKMNAKQIEKANVLVQDWSTQHKSQQNQTKQQP